MEVENAKTSPKRKGLVMNLRPCPFCGSDDVTVSWYLRCIICLDCDTRGPADESMKIAVEKWNSRRRDGGLEEENKRLLGLVESAIPWMTAFAESEPVNLWRNDPDTPFSINKWIEGAEVELSKAEMKKEEK